MSKPDPRQAELFPEPDEPRRPRPGDEYDPSPEEQAAFEAALARETKRAKSEKVKK